MPIKKSEQYSSLWKSCDELRDGMDASQYKDYVPQTGSPAGPKPQRPVQRTRGPVPAIVAVVSGGVDRSPLGHGEWGY